MKNLVFRAAVSIATCSALLFACSSDEDVRVPFETDAEAFPDAPPPATPEKDAGIAETGDVDARPPFDAAAPEIECDATPCITRIMAGPTHYCALATDGLTRCWGNASAIGDFAMDAGTDTAAGATPVVLPGVTDVVDIAAATLITCVAHTDGGVECFGFRQPSPEPVPNVSNAKRIAVGDRRSCAVLADGTAQCWGDGIGTGSGDTTLDLGGEKAVSVAMKQYVGFALTESGRLLSWGNDINMLGRETSLNTDLTPRRVEHLPPVRDFSASDKHACALSTDGRLFCWGRGDNGALGLGYIRTEYYPVEVLFSGSAWPAQVSASDTHTCARMTDGTLDCWGGSNSIGHLGYEDTAGVYRPRKVEGLTDVVAVAVGTLSTCALSKDGRVRCWGDNTYGQLGRGTRDGKRHPSPLPVVFP